MTENYSLVSGPRRASQCFVADLEEKQDCEVVLMVSWGQGGQGTKGLTS